MWGGYGLPGSSYHVLEFAESVIRKPLEVGGLPIILPSGGVGGEGVEGGAKGRGVGGDDVVAMFAANFIDVFAYS